MPGAPEAPVLLHLLLGQISFLEPIIERPSGADLDVRLSQGTVAVGIMQEPRVFLQNLQWE